MSYNNYLMRMHLAASTEFANGLCDYQTYESVGVGVGANNLAAYNARVATDLFRFRRISRLPCKLTGTANASIRFYRSRDCP